MGRSVHAGAGMLESLQTTSTTSPSGSSKSPPIQSASVLSTYPAEKKSPNSPTGKPLKARRETTSSISELKLREARPFLGRNRPKIFDKYKLLNTLGKGQFGTVFAVEERSHPLQFPASTDETPGAESKKQEPRAYACKVVDIATNGVDDDDSTINQSSSLLQEVLNEIEMMLGPDGARHQNVQDLVDFVIEDDKAYIISSLCRGGDLAEALDMRGCLCEEDAMNVMAGIFKGLAHLHSRGVGHRDLKLENILLTDSKHDMSKVKIIDLGFAKQLASPGAKPCSEALNTVCGTPMYIAPELIRPSLQTRMIKGKALYGTQADMWSCGVILYWLLSGFPPFDPADSASMFDLFENIARAAYDLSDPVWEMVSVEALSMIECLLEPDPQKRLTAEEALRHPWMAGR